ncbi:MAG: CotH kinase family protein, partial [Pseudomonadota bacterium]
FSDFTNYVQSHRIPDALFKSGRTVKELRLLEFGSSPKIKAARFAMQVPMDQLPSSVAVESIVAEHDGPLLSIVADNDDLYHPRTGLLTHYLEHGRKWERPVFISYFEDGKILFAGGVGLRVHGGQSRYMEEKSFRLHFRDIYGDAQLPQGILYGGKGDPIKSLIVHNDVRRMEMEDGSVFTTHFTNPLAFDIARQIGCLTPATKPVQLYLNGEYAGPYVLIEHISLEFLRAHFGKGNFTYGRSKAKPLPGRTVAKGNPDALLDLYNEFNEIDPPLTMNYVNHKVDLANMTNWLISILITGTTDAFQGAIVKDSSSADSRWFWINWDMDHAFRDVYSLAPAGRPWEIDLFSGPHSLVDRKRIRSLIFRRLSRESPAYKTYFLRRFIDAFNHQVTTAFVRERISYYEKIAASFDISDTSYISSRKNYLDKRPTILRNQVSLYFDAGPVYRMVVISPESIDLTIDGYDVNGMYVGWYVNETPADIRISRTQKDQLFEWVINGKRIANNGSSMSISMNSEMVIEVAPLKSSSSTE